MKFKTKVIALLTYTTLLISLIVFINDTHVKQYHNNSTTDEMSNKILELKKEIDYNSEKCEVLRQVVNYLISDAQKARITDTDKNKLKTISTEKR